MKSLQYAVASFALAATLAVPAHAATIVHTTLDAYRAATAPNTTLNFSNHQFTYSGSGYGSTPLGTRGTFGGVTFREASGRLYVFSSGFYSDKVGGNYLNNNSGGTVVTLEFAVPITAFALNFGVLYNWGSAAALKETFTVGGASFAFTLPGEMANNGVAPSFIGFTSDTAFSTVSIFDPTRGLAIRDLMFGNVLVNKVPEPASFALLGLGLGLLGAALASRRKRRH